MQPPPLTAWMESNSAVDAVNAFCAICFNATPSLVHPDSALSPAPPILLCIRCQARVISKLISGRVLIQEAV